MVQRLVHWNIDSPELERTEKFHDKPKGIIKNTFVNGL